MVIREYIVLPSPRKRPCILHVTSSAQIGGTERMLIRFLGRCNRDRFQHHVVAMQPEGPLLDAVAELGHSATGLASQNPLHPGARGEMRALLRNKTISLIHAYGLRADILARTMARKAKIPAFVSAIRSPDPWRGPLHVWLDRWTARGGRVNLFISNSEAGRQSRIVREKFPGNQIITIPNGIDLPDPAPPSREEVAALRAKYGLTNQTHPLVAVVANLRPMKGHLDLIAALALLKETHPRLHLLFAGRDDSEGAIENAARNSGMRGRIAFCGFVDDPLPLVRLADLYCMPSHWEGCPTALLEAMALAKPIIATKVGGIPELVRHKEEATLVPPGNPQALAQAIADLLARPQEAERLGRKAAARARENFSLNTMIARIEEAYDGLLRQAHPAAASVSVLPESKDLLLETEDARPE